MDGIIKLEGKQAKPDHIAANRNLSEAPYFSAAPLYIGFAMTGISVALPGVLLPILLKRWSLADGQGGVLFLLAWLGSSLGALLVRGSLRALLICGSLATAIGAYGLATTGGSRMADLSIALFGLGLGITMTSISLIRAQQTRGAPREMVRLNLVWAIGACVCPTLSLPALASGQISTVLFGLASSFGLLAVWAIFHPAVHLVTATPKMERPWKLFQTTPWRLIVMAFLITGVEASIGGWLSTYVHHGAHRLAQAVAAPTCLWAGLLLSRLFWSVRMPSSSDAYTHAVRVSLALMVGAAALLTADTQPIATLAAALFLGVAIGPLYPLLLATALRFQRGGAIFFVAGVGSAFLSWLTGAVSSLRHSLRFGLSVPIVASSIMLLLSMSPQMAQWTRQSSDITPEAS